MLILGANRAIMTDWQASGSGTK